MELMPLCIHGYRGPVFVLPHFAKQNFLIRRRWQQFLSETPCQHANPWHRLPPD